MHHSCFLAAAAIILLSFTSAKADELSFDLPKLETGKSSPISLWSTYYHIWSAKEKNTGIPLLNKNNKKLTGNLSEKDWCLAAIEGTVVVQASNGSVKTFNYADKKGENQVDCSKTLNISPIKNPWIKATGKSRFKLAQEKYGDGVNSYKLIPYRTIAVDSSKIPYGTVVYIPKARGVTIKLPSGKNATHDGYFYAADTGGAIEANHIDVFSGTQTANPFPQFIYSKPESTFDAFVVTDPAINEKLTKLHL